MSTTNKTPGRSLRWALSARGGTEPLRGSVAVVERPYVTPTATLAPPDSMQMLPPRERTAAIEERGDAAPEDRTKVDVIRARREGPQGRRDDAGAGKDADGLVGATLGSYRLLAQIGRGGMGAVYRAQHVHLGREVALKVLRSEHSRRKDAVTRFFHEARTVNRVRHRNIVDVTDLVELEDGTTFIIMELVVGRSLSVWANSPKDAPRVLRVLAQICDGLAAAHSVHVVHRDLKPDNVIVSRGSDGSDLVKVLDFGVAKLLHCEDEEPAFETEAGSILGTPAYMSPEQAGGLVIDLRSDIYSLGAIMYEVFCGQPMFRGTSFADLVRKHLTETPVAPRATPRGKRIDPRIEAIILRAIEKDPDRRYQSATEVRDAMLSLASTLQESRLAEWTPPAQTRGAASSCEPSVWTSIASSASSARRTSDITPHATVIVYSSSRSHERPRELLRRGAPYVWFFGGALAVAMGIGGASWYARAASAIPARVTFEATLESHPSNASVIEAESTAIVCRTPCTLKLSPSRADARDVRQYVLSIQGYAEAPLSIDLRGSARRFVVALAPAAPSPAPVPVPSPATPSAQAVSEAEITAALPSAPRNRRRAPPTAAAASPDTTAPRGRREVRIDSSETMDPFRTSPRMAPAPR